MKKCADKCSDKTKQPTKNNETFDLVRTFSDNERQTTEFEKQNYRIKSDTVHERFVTTVEDERQDIQKIEVKD